MKQVSRLLTVSFVLITAVSLSGCLYRQYPPSWQSDPAIQSDPEIKAARRACRTAPRGEKFECLEAFAVDTLNPNVCGLTGIYIDDACLQSVWQASDDVTICERIYLVTTRPNCYAHFRQSPLFLPLYFPAGFPFQDTTQSTTGSHGTVEDPSIVLHFDGGEGKSFVIEQRTGGERVDVEPYTLLGQVAVQDDSVPLYQLVDDTEGGSDSLPSYISL